MVTSPVSPTPRVTRLACDWPADLSESAGAPQSLPLVLTTWKCPTCRVLYVGTVRQIIQAMRLVLVFPSGTSALMGTGCQLCQEVCLDPDFPTVGVALSQLVPKRNWEDFVAPRSPYSLGERPAHPTVSLEADGG
jgi:hypothetical protein